MMASHPSFHSELNLLLSPVLLRIIGKKSLFDFSGKALYFHCPSRAFSSAVSVIFSLVFFCLIEFFSVMSGFAWSIRSRHLNAHNMLLNARQSLCLQPVER